MVGGMTRMPAVQELRGFFGKEPHKVSIPMKLWRSCSHPGWCAGWGSKRYPPVEVTP